MRLTRFMNMNGMCITPFTISKAIALSGLELHMSLAQLLSLEAMSMQSFTVKEVLEDLKPAAVPEIPWETKHTLCGVPIIVNKKMCETTIELCLGEQVLMRIENLAIPCGTAKNEQYGWNLA